jgi:hypothetical protein
VKTAIKHHHSYLHKKLTSKEISKDTLIASITKNDISTVQACAWHQANIKKDFVCLIKGTNPSRCGYLDGSCSLLVHRECAIECCRAVGIVYTLEDGKSAKCPNRHKSFKKKLNWEVCQNIITKWTCQFMDLIDKAMIVVSSLGF